MRGLWGIAILGLMVVTSSCAKDDGGALKFSGTLELEEHSLGARVPGRLASLQVEEGDVVTAGQLIATLDRHEQAKKDHDRAGIVFKEGGADEQSVEYARLAVEDQEITSPVDGIVLVKVHQVGEVVGAGVPVVIIGQQGAWWVRIYVPESAINRIRLHDPASVRLDGLDKPLAAHVTYIATKAEFTPRNVQTPEERITQTFAVKVTLDDPKGVGHPGVPADVYIQTKG